MKRYWFKPKRFWGIFAAYYPVRREGWIVTIVLLAAAVFIFKKIDQASHSVSDTLIGFAPWLIGILLVFDLLCFRTGEYPRWWRRRE